MKTLQNHLESSGHKLSTAAADTRQGELSAEFRKNELAKRAAVKLSLKTVYWVVKEEIANRKYKSLIQFLQGINVPEALYLNKGKNATHTSPDIFDQLLAALNTVSINQLKVALKHSPFIAVGIDESTDRAQEQHVAIVIRYISQRAELITTFLCCKKVKQGTAQCIFETLSCALKEFNIPFNKVVGLGTDGAATMTSPQNGVNGLVSRQNPFCVFIHCICHRLHLAAGQACHGIPAMQILIKIVSTVYTFVQNSPKRLEKFNDISKILALDSIKFKKVFEIRWLSLGDALIAILRNFEALVILLEDQAAEGDPVAIGLYQQLTSFKYISLLALTADVLSVVNNLSRFFQHNDICFSAFGTNLQDCNRALHHLKTQDGPFMTSFQTQLLAGVDGTLTYKGHTISTKASRGERVDQCVAFNEVRKQFLVNITQNIENRFPQVELLYSMQIFEPAKYCNETQLGNWGNNDLEVLLEKYGQQQTTGDEKRFDRLVDPDACRAEFLPFKRLVYRQRGEMKQTNNGEMFQYHRPSELLQKLFGSEYTGNKNIYPEMYRLMCICLCVLVGNAEAERVFSCQNRIKSKSRTRLTVDHLDQLIRISYSKTPFHETHFENAATEFLNQCGSRRL